MPKSSTVGPPIPLGPDEINRVTHTRLRRRLLYSEFEPDLISRLRKNLGNVRQSAWGQPDLTANPYLSMWTGAAALYDEEPTVRVPAGSDGLVESMAELGFWAQQQRVMRDTLALREMLICADIDAAGVMTAEPVFPDMVKLTANPRRPSVPIRVEHYVEHPDYGWVTYDTDLRDPTNPRRTVVSRKGEPLTQEVLGGNFSGESYPYHDADGNPILNYVLYHAAETGCLFDGFTHREVVEGSLNIGVLLTFYNHLVRNAAWAQRYAVNLRPIGLGAERTDGRAGRLEVVTDPATLLLLEQVDGTVQGTTGQWSSPGDPEAVLRSIGMYERRIQLLAGFAPPDVTRQEADIRSGYSLAVDREALRARQRVFEPQFRRGDQQVLRLVACLSNRAMGTTYSENAADYRPEYRGLPRTPAEVRLHLEEVKAKRDAGMIGPISALMEIEPALNYEEAVAKLAHAAIEKAEVEETTRGLLQSTGRKAAPAAMQLEVGKITTLTELVSKAQAGEIPTASLYAILVSALGFTPDAAKAITDPIVPRQAQEAA